MSDDTRGRKVPGVQERMYLVPLSAAGLLILSALILQPWPDLLSGFAAIQLGEAGLITDATVTGGVGGALLNAGLVTLLSALLIWRMGLPVTGLSLACLFLMAGFAMLGKNLVNIAPILLGGWLYARYKRDPFSKYVYLTLFGTCLSPMVSFFLTHIDHPVLAWGSMAVCGVLIGFFTPPLAAYTARVHQGYDLYNVGFAAGFLGLASASVLKGVGVEFTNENSWGREDHLVLSVLTLLILLGLLGAGAALGCRRWRDYRPILRHSGRAVADFILLDGPAVTLVNMALMGGIGFLYLLTLYPMGVRLNGPLVCCLLSMAGFGAFGKHPRNAVPVMAGAVLAKYLLVRLPITAPGVLLATLLSTGLAPIAGQFGWRWGVAAGFLHMTIVQNTGILHGGMNLYNNGFAAGMVCILLVPIIEALRPEPEE